jgi:hypothetical protein
MINERYFPEVVQAVPGENKTVYAYFTDGSIHLYDVMPLIQRGGVFAQLEDERFFTERLTVLNGTVAWDVSGTFDPTTCIDIDPFEVYQSIAVPDPLEEVI